MSDRSTTDDQSFLYSIRKLKTTDRGHADVFNELFQQLIANDVHLKKSKIDTDGDASNLKVSDITECSSKFPVPEIDDRLKVVIGKVKKFAEDFKGWYTGVGLIDNIVDNCTSMDTDKPLSAAQGKTLWDKIVEVATTLTTHKSSGDHDSRYYTENETNNLLNAKVNTSGIVNNCTSTASNLPLSAAQGKALMDKYNQLNGDLGSRGVTYWSTVENITIPANVWATGSHSIKLPAGSYVISAHAELPAGDCRAYITVDSMDFAEQYVSIPSSVDLRRATTTFVAFFERETTTRVKLFSAAGGIATRCEISAIRI